MTKPPLDPQWAEWYDCYFGHYEEDMEFFLHEAQAGGGPVLEAGCGTGRLTIPMLQLGVDVAGFDPMDGMLERLKQKAEKAGVTPQVECADMASFRSDRRFEQIIVPFRVFNHCLTPASQRAALENLRCHLAPGGRVLLATFVPDPELTATATNMVQYMATVVHPDTMHAVVCSNFNAEIDVLNQRRTDVWVYEEIDARDRVTRKAYLPLEIRWVHPTEMSLLFELAGFTEIETYGGFDYSPLEEECREQVWIAR